MTLREVTIVVPVKGLDTAKSRLTPALRAGARRRLALDLFEHVLGVCTNVPDAEVVIVSPDPSVGEMARDAGANWTRDPELGLNPSLARVFESCWREGRTPFYVPSDLPLVAASDLESIIHTESGIAIAPSRNRRGTNALMVSPETPMAPELGDDSFIAHLARADALGYDVSVCELPNVAFDVDTPTDWAELRMARAERVASS